MKVFPSSYFDMIFADPPYFLSNNGLSISSGKIVSVNKGEWDKSSNYGDKIKFTFAWLSQCYRVLKSSGTIWVSGTHHNIFDVANIMKRIGFKVINVIVWHKEDPPPLIFKNKFKFSHEMIIWACKAKKYYFNYQDMFEIGKEEMEDVWTLPSVSMEEKKFGKHPTQKPLLLIKRIILASTKEGDLVLDPFMGSGTTGVACKELNRRFYGIEREDDFFELSKIRIRNFNKL